MSAILTSNCVLSLDIHMQDLCTYFFSLRKYFPNVTVPVVSEVFEAKLMIAALGIICSHLRGKEINNV